ncbi:hypothetical protein E2C01_100904 [Portunus trituberculatus]|uniref:Uncharacterized protein n=1 Tax=Portunus trituberculatus TaxID=210409 RepID=A0A5B7K979_PORTR|nr:hypothetical protein [Portunus trituberculatus]
MRVGFVCGWVVGGVLRERSGWVEEWKVAVRNAECRDDGKQGERNEWVGGWAGYALCPAACLLPGPPQGTLMV